MLKRFLAPATLPAALLAAACGGPSDTSVAGVDAGCFNRTTTEIGGPFTLTDNTGAQMTEQDALGQRSLVFFGFTYCPDICPITLYKAGQAIELLPDDVRAPRTLFISVDPERDTPETLSQYIASNGFPQDIVGLTGTPEQLQEVSENFLAPFEKVETTQTASGYLVNHSAFLYLMDPDWKLETFFTPADTPETISACLTALERRDPAS